MVFGTVFDESEKVRSRGLSGVSQLRFSTSQRQLIGLTESGLTIGALEVSVTRVSVESDEIYFSSFTLFSLLPQKFTLSLPLLTQLLVSVSSAI